MWVIFIVFEEISKLPENIFWLLHSGKLEHKLWYSYQIGKTKHKISIQLGDTNSVNAEIFNRKILFLDISLFGLHTAKCDKAVNLNSTVILDLFLDISLLGLHVANFRYSSQTCVGENYYLFCWLGLRAAKWQDLITMNTDYFI